MAFSFTDADFADFFESYVEKNYISSVQSTNYFTYNEGSSKDSFVVHLFGHFSIKTSMFSDEK